MAVRIVRRTRELLRQMLTYRTLLQNQQTYSSKTIVIHGIASVKNMREIIRDTLILSAVVQRYIWFIAAVVYITSAAIQGFCGL